MPDLPASTSQVLRLQACTTHLALQPDIMIVVTYSTETQGLGQIIPGICSSGLVEEFICINMVLVKGHGKSQNNELRRGEGTREATEYTDLVGRQSHFCCSATESLLLKPRVCSLVIRCLLSKDLGSISSKHQNNKIK